MITNVSLPIIPKAAPQKTAPSFGFAKLNDLGRQTADSFGYKQNDFLSSEMFKKPGFFQKKSLLASKINKGADFTDLCTIYGCTKNSKANAEFIVNQVLSPKSSSAINSVDEEVKANGLIALYNANYDNPDLSLKHTKALLDMISESIEPEEYVKNIGILEVGTKE